jgi:hypothetical protein
MMYIGQYFVELMAANGLVMYRFLTNIYRDNSKQQVNYPPLTIQFTG